MKKKLSIIVPVYNVEKYIDKCLESLVNQTIDNYEIIIVVDGSEDNSIEIVRKYEKLYPELITFYETENHGLSAARNYGLERANGEYIGFVDSDDCVNIEMFEKLYNYATKNNCDMVVCDYYQITDNGNNLKKLEIEENDTRESIVIKSKPYAWNKIYKKDIFNTYNIKFPEGLIFEDICSVYPLLIQAEKIGYVAEPLYNYTFNRDDSIMNNKKIKSLSMLKVLKIFNKYCKEHNLFKKYYNLICEINVRHIYYRINKINQNANTKLYNLRFIFKSFVMLDLYFPKWRTQCEYSKKINKKKKNLIYLQLKILLKETR